MEAIVLLGGVIVAYGGFWSLSDLLRDAGINPLGMLDRMRRRADKPIRRTGQACSALRSRDISSSTACRAGLSPCRIL